MKKDIASQPIGLKATGFDPVQEGSTPSLAAKNSQGEEYMETKICTKCGKELSIEEFNWRNKAKGTRRSECKYCHSGYMQRFMKMKDDREYIIRIQNHYEHHLTRLTRKLRVYRVT